MGKNRVTLIGAGLAGSLLSIYLAKRGFQVEIYERRPDMRREKISAGRSINLAISHRGIFALQEVGLKEQIMRLAIPMKGRLIHSLTGGLTFYRYGQKDSEVINSISRADLNKHLMNTAEAHGVEIHFNQRCTGLDLQTGTLTLRNEKSGGESTKPAQIVLGSDGSASAVRRDMLKAGDFHFTQEPLEHGYKELTIPPGRDGAFQLEKNALHIWPRHKYMLIALPNLDASFTCTLFFPHEGEPSFATLDSEEKVLAFFKKQFPDAVPLMPTLLEDFFTNPTGHLVTIRCRPWHVNGRACLLGDAAHAIVPFFGQGMNCAFEDCTIFNNCLAETGPKTDWEQVFQTFEARRKVDADAIADMALDNYFEMRDRVADPKFGLKRDVEFALERRFPRRFIPRYSMVSFHRLPYAMAQQRGQIQEEILRELCGAVETVEELDWERAEELVTTRLTDIL